MMASQGNDTTPRRYQRPKRKQQSYLFTFLTMFYFLTMLNNVGYMFLSKNHCCQWQSRYLFRQCIKHAVNPRRMEDYGILYYPILIIPILRWHFSMNQVLKAPWNNLRKNRAMDRPTSNCKNKSIMWNMIMNLCYQHYMLPASNVLER